MIAVLPVGRNSMNQNKDMWERENVWRYAGFSIAGHNSD